MFVKSHRVLVTIAATLACAIVYPSVQAAEDKSVKAGSSASGAGKEQISRGRYLLMVGNCNDCHTAGFAASEGKVPEKDWLLGDGALGLTGPWGTTYATNLRLSLSKMTEDQWVQYAKTLKTRPPMPWFNLNQWAEPDLRVFFQYVRQLGPAGSPVSAPLPPDKKPPAPYVQWPMPPVKAQGGSSKVDTGKK
jgi:mono/diheme cytochrome c family protein